MFSFANPLGGNTPIEVRITAKNSELTVEQPFGDIKVTLKFSRFNGNTADITPECTEVPEASKTAAFGFLIK